MINDEVTEKEEEREESLFLYFPSLYSLKQKLFFFLFLSFGLQLL